LKLPVDVQDESLETQWERQLSISRLQLLVSMVEKGGLLPPGAQQMS